MLSALEAAQGQSLFCTDDKKEAPKSQRNPFQSFHELSLHHPPEPSVLWPLVSSLPYTHTTWEQERQWMGTPGEQQAAGPVVPALTAQQRETHFAATALLH